MKIFNSPIKFFNSPPHHKIYQSCLPIADVWQHIVNCQVLVEHWFLSKLNVYACLLKHIVLSPSQRWFERQTIAIINRNPVIDKCLWPPAIIINRLFHGLQNFIFFLKTDGSKCRSIRSCLVDRLIRLQFQAGIANGFVLRKGEHVWFHALNLVLEVF